MIPSESEMKNKGKQLMAMGVGFLVFMVGNFVFYLLCHDHGMAFIAGAGLGFCTYVMQISGALVAPEVMQPPAKLYNLTPIYILAEIKSLLSTQYFGDRKWIPDETNQEKLTMQYSFKHSKEVQMNEPGQMGGGQPQKKEGIVTLTVEIERVGDGASIETTFRIPHGTIDFDVQDVIKQTTSLIDAALRALEAQKQA